MQDSEKTEKFDIKKLPRLEISKPMDQMMRTLGIILLVIVPSGVLFRGLMDGMIEPGKAFLAGIFYVVIVTSLYYGIKRYYVLDQTRRTLFRVTRIFGSVMEKFVCPLSDISCIAIDSRERTTKNGTSTGQFWYESCLILKNKKVIRLHRTFEDSYDEIQDAEQYAEYLGCPFFLPKPGLTMKVATTHNGETIVEFVR